MTPMADRFTCRRPSPLLKGPNVPKASQFIELLPRRGGGWCANHQRIGKDRGAEERSFWLRVKSRRASFPSVVEPARPAGWGHHRSGGALAFCFFDGPWAASTYAKTARSAPPAAAAIQGQSLRMRPGLVEPSLTPGASSARQARRGAAGFNHALQRL